VDECIRLDGPRLLLEDSNNPSAAMLDMSFFKDSGVYARSANLSNPDWLKLTSSNAMTAVKLKKLSSLIPIYLKSLHYFFVFFLIQQYLH